MADNESDTIELDMKGLDTFLKACKSTPTARVGVLGSKSNRNAEKNDGLIFQRECYDIFDEFIH